MSKSALTKYDAARQAIDAAKSTDEVKKIRNEADMMRAYARQIRDRKLELDAVEIRLRAERRLGQLMAMQRRGGLLAKGAAQKGVGRRGKRGYASDPHLARITYDDLSINKRLADDVRKLAKPDDDTFERLIASWRSRAEEQLEPIRFRLFKKSDKPTVVEAEEEDDKTLGEKYEDYSGFSPEDPRRHILSTEENREKLRSLLRENAQAPIGAEVEKGFENVAAIVVDALWYLHMSHFCLTGWSRLNNINATFNELDERVKKLMVALDKNTGIP